MSEQSETLDRLTKDQAIKDLVTPNGKKLGIYHVQNTALFKVAFQSGGELPSELNGMYTDTERAYEAAKKYVERRWAEKPEPATEEGEHSERGEEREAPQKKQPGRPRKQAS